MEARARELWTSQQMTKQERKRYAPSRGPVVPFLEEIELLHPPMLAREGCGREGVKRFVRRRVRVHLFGRDSQGIFLRVQGAMCAAVMVEVELWSMRRW